MSFQYKATFYGRELNIFADTKNGRLVISDLSNQGQKDHTVEFSDIRFVAPAIGKWLVGAYFHIELVDGSSIEIPAQNKKWNDVVATGSDLSKLIGCEFRKTFLMEHLKKAVSRFLVLIMILTITGLVVGWLAGQVVLKYNLDVNQKALKEIVGGGLVLIFLICFRVFSRKGTNRRF